MATFDTNNSVTDRTWVSLCFLHVMYIKDEHIVVFIFVLDLLGTGVVFSGSSVACLGSVSKNRLISMALSD